MKPKISWKQTDNFEQLYLGQILVGSVMPDGGHRNRPRWTFKLKGICVFWQDEKTVSDAREALITALHDWLARAGLL